MTLTRARFFLLLFMIVISPFLIYKLIWLARSEKTNGTMGFEGRSYTGQIGHTYSVISFVKGNETFWFNSNDNILFKPGETVPVRYQKNNPKDARVNIFASIWGDTVVYGGIPLIILLIIFVHPAIIPRRSNIHLSSKKPFIRII